MRHNAQYEGAFEYKWRSRVTLECRGINSTTARVEGGILVAVRRRSRGYVRATVMLEICEKSVQQGRPTRAVHAAGTPLSGKELEDHG